eukprot:2133957-Pleurochrysis_carterae.AAC.1
MAGDVRVRNRGEMLATWCWVCASSAKLQAGRQTNESAQSERIAVPETEKSQGRKPKAETMGLSLGNESAWSFLPATALPVKAAGGKRGG